MAFRQIASSARGTDGLTSLGLGKSPSATLLKNSSFLARPKGGRPVAREWRVAPRA